MKGVFVGLERSQILSIRSNALAELERILARGESYGIAERNRSIDLSKVNETIAECNYALNRLSQSSSTFLDFRRRI